ncbi:MAG: MATE family efflux transporter [bacterium]|nr:MAG: MATE family efflux transporter [bacterium]
MAMKTGLGSILKTSVPIIVDLAAQILMWTIEINLVSRIAPALMNRTFPGAGATAVDALTAVGNVVQIIILTFTALLIFVFGATIIINRLLGEGNHEEANHFLGQSIFTALFPAIAISGLWYLLAPILFEFVLGTPAAVTVVGVEYFRILSYFTPFIIMNFVAIGIVRGAGDTHLAMITGLIVNCLHLVLALFLIFGLGICPPLGVRGAALAAGIAHTIGCIFTYSVILRGKSVLTFNWHDFRTIKGSTIKRVLRTGTPITLEQLAWMVGITVVIGFSNRLGTVAAAAHIIVLTFQRLFSILYQAFGMGALTLVGQRYGASEHDHARQTTVQFFWLVCAVVLFLVAIIFFRARYFVMLFTNDPEVLSLCATVLKVAAFVQIPKALSYVYSFSLRGVGENRYPMYLAIFGVIAFEVILGYNMAFTFGLSLVGLWIAQGIDEVFKVSFAARRFYSRVALLTG